MRIVLLEPDFEVYADSLPAVGDVIEVKQHEYVEPGRWLVLERVWLYAHPVAALAPPLCAGLHVKAIGEFNPA